ncbi:hypothetical protein ACQP3J_34130, partial [Escherichia coli]
PRNKSTRMELEDKWEVKYARLQKSHLISFTCRASRSYYLGWERQQLKVFAALAEDPSSVPSIHL